MKKLLVFILLLIITAGTVIPCCGADDCCEGETTNAPVSQNQKDEGACSPFFACASCPCFFVETKPVLLVKHVEEKQIHHPGYLSFNFSGFSSTCWQPPRNC